MSDQPNPSAAPDPGAEAAPGGSAVGEDKAALEQTRRKNVRREASIRSIGTLFLFGAVVSMLAMIGSVLTLPVRMGLFELLFYGVAVVIDGLVAVWLRNLDPRGRIGATILMGLALLGHLSWAAFTAAEAMQEPALLGPLLIPVAAIAGLLYVLWSRPSGEVFSEHYRNVVVPATPHVKYRSTVAIVILAVLLLVLVGLVIRAMLSML